MDSFQLENEVLDALQCVENGENFVLEGGAGSGKTYSLISIINALIAKDENVRIVCITYTNNAVAEITARVASKNLWVSTIHEFMWMVIKQFQSEIKGILVEFINDETEKIFKKPKNYDDRLISYDYFKDIIVDYDEYYSMTPNVNNRVTISHDHVLIVAERIFEKYEKISDILKDVADCIFVDEYQDTSQLVTDIFLNHLQQSNKKNVIGFFGDSMQSIYDSGVGNLNNYKLKKIIKRQNRRNPRLIIDAANKFRDDGIVQVPSEDINAPNMENGTIVDGSIKFLYGSNDTNINTVKDNNIFESWDFTDGNNTKELRLTHRYNAEMAGFRDLFELYNSDLIIILVDKINKKIKKEGLIKDHTLNQLATSFKLKYKKRDLLEQILENETYFSIYDVLKDIAWEEVYLMCNVNKESLLSYKFNGKSGRYESNSNRDRILMRLDVLNEVIELYSDNRLNEFFRLTEFIVNSNEDIIKLKQIIDFLTEQDGKTIEQVLIYAEQNGMLKNDELFDDYIQNKGFYLWERIKRIPFEQYRKSIFYLNEFSPIRTQHSIKGSEYNNVFLVLDSDWNFYDFHTLFGKGSQNPNVILRTKKLFYVSITRAKKNLIMYMPTTDLEIIAAAEEYFGENNVLKIS
ncbi:UvrD-helicase domain-containing protein [Erysipelothrix rhusiopathiae]|uniref:UvrD-helicase domain-containing protein n=1 Tax=Erysipelothrix rhusiopathiae TaxID=1648 RepID=UPI0024818D2F|nr:UvrD-helicase domain-containing protein [Erysipelothrix rhusiopathiae]